MTWLALGIFIAFLLVGVAGVVLPVLPGVPLVLVGAALAAWIRGFDVVGVMPLVWIAVLAILAQVVDFVAGAVGARMGGAGRAGFWGGVLGSLIGLIWFPPIGFLLGALVGAVAAEVVAGRSLPDAWRAGLGAFVGTIGGVAAKALILVAMAVVMIPVLL